MSTPDKKELQRLRAKLKKVKELLDELLDPEDCTCDPDYYQPSPPCPMCTVFNELSERTTQQETEMLTWKPDFENAENVGIIRLTLDHTKVESFYFLGNCVDAEDLHEAADRRMYLGDLDDLPLDLWMDGRSKVEVCTDLRAVEAFQTLTALGVGEFGPVLMQRIRERLAQYRIDRQWNKHFYG